MKICPKCRGFYPDDDIKCQECRIDLMDKTEYSKIHNELDKMGSKKRRMLCKEPKYKSVCKYQFSADYNYDEEKSKAEFAEMRQRAKLHKIETEQKDAEQNIPRCPTCGSINVEPISHLRKLGGLLTIGLASKSVGKSYRCLDCKYYW